MKIISTLSLFTLVLLGYVGMTSFTSVPPKKKAAFDATYDAEYISTVQVGNNYEWTWSVTNPYPGSGTDGTTLQNLSHWSMAISDLVTINDIVGVQYSLDGINWMDLPVSLAIDKSQECYLGSVLKFNYGTTGSAPTYYKLTVNKYFTSGSTLANFKSGAKTGCYNGTVTSIGVPDDGSTNR
jgi:hypothetical protein